LREILQKQPNVGSNTENIAFHRSFAVSCVVASFLLVENWTSIKCRFFFFFILFL